MKTVARWISPGLEPGECPAIETPVRLNLGCGRNAIPGWVNVDCVRLPGVDLLADLEDCRLPFGDNNVGEILLSHTLEHIRNSLPLMQELHRVAKPDSLCVVRVPYGSSDDAWEDPTHVRAYFLQSWLYFSQPAYFRADYGYRGDWKPALIKLCVPKALTVNTTAQDLLARINRERNLVSEMVAVLRAVKPIREPKRDLQVAPAIRIIPV